MDLATRLDNIRVRVKAPGTEIEAELSERANIALFFMEGDYAFVTEPKMERAIESIAKLLWVGWQRQYKRAIEYTNLIIDAETSTDMRFFAARDEVQAVGESSDRRIRVSTVGMKKYSVDIEPGTLRELSESEFCAGVSEAAGKLIQEYQAKVEVLKWKYYD